MPAKKHLIVAGALALVAAGAMTALSRPAPADIRTVMKAKLGHAQSVLEGLALENFAQIEQNAQALSALSRAAGWGVHDTPEYIKFSEDFRAIANSLAANAHAKKLEAATLDYLQLTMTCVKCHSHVRKVGVARGPADPDGSLARR